MERLLTRIPVLALLCALALPARAQVDQDPQVWTSFASTVRLGEGDSGPALWLDTHLRRSGSGTVYILRPGVGWKHERWLSAWVGYAWVPVWPDEGEATHEHRIWQQVILERGLPRVSLQLRTRFEQRLGDGSGDPGFRLREFGRVGWSFRDGGRVGLVFWDELFVGLNDTDWGAPAGFDQNRAFGGLFVKSEDSLRVEIGYLSLYLNREQDTQGHVLSTSLFASF